MWAGFLAGMAAYAGEWWNRDWPYRQHVALDGRAVDEDLVDFPVRLQLDDAHFARTLAAGDGSDLRAVTANGEVLPLQLVSWTPDHVRVFVRVPRIKAGDAEQGFDLYFGHPTTTRPEVRTLWNGENLAVLHLAGDVNDATGRQPAVLRSGYVVQNGRTAGLVLEKSYPWLTFERDHPGFLQLSVPPAETELTVIGRFRPSAVEGRLTLFSGTGFDVVAQGSRLLFRSSGSELALEGLETNSWHAVVASYNPATGTRRLGLDGRIFASDQGIPAELSPSVRVGRGTSDTPDAQFSGDVEELRIIGGPLSRSWLKAAGLNLSDGNPLVAMGPLQRSDGRAAQPSPPQLVAPVDQAESHKPAGIELRWLPACGADSYEVLIFAHPRDESPVTRLPVGTQLALTLTADQTRSRDFYWTVAAQSQAGETRGRELRQLSFHVNDQVAEGRIALTAAAPVLTRACGLEIELRGYLGDRVKQLTQSLIAFDGRNPGMLRMLRERPEKNIPPWAGVFPGQYLSSAQLVWRLTHNGALKAHVDDYVRKLAATQRADGYLGPFEGMEDHLALWNHYAVLTGLLDYHEDTGSALALNAAKKIGDLVLRKFGPAGTTLPKNGGANEAISHALARLAHATGDARYRDFASYVITEVWNEPGGVAYERLGRERAAISAFPVRRWEGVHNLMTLSEMFWLTGNTTYRDDFEYLWRTLGRTERHATGGFSTNEGLLGTPYNRGTIETCSTVAWTMLSTDMLRLSGDSSAADELEWSTLNSALGSIPFNGAGSTYGTQPDGLRQFNVLHQGPPDGPELSCCSTNAARALGNLANWSLMQASDGLALNYYGPSNISANLPSGNRVSLTQVTDYPTDNTIRLEVTTRSPETFTLRLRIPAWSTHTRLSVNGQPLPPPVAGTQAVLHRRWTSGDVILLELDFTPRFETGREDYTGQACVFRGPLLLASDARYTTDHRPFSGSLNPSKLTVEPLALPSGAGPWLLARLTDGDGRCLTVCDFSSAGLFGSEYRSWFDLKPAK